MNLLQYDVLTVNRTNKTFLNITITADAVFR